MRDRENSIPEKPDFVECRSGKPADIAKIDRIPNQMTPEPDSKSSSCPSDGCSKSGENQRERNVGQAAVKERISVPADSEEGDVKIRKRRAEIAWEKSDEHEEPGFSARSKQERDDDEREDGDQAMFEAIFRIDAENPDDKLG